jgi:hypothetical protein
MAAALAITQLALAAWSLARRKWPQKAGNDGKARIGVPAERIPDKPHVIVPNVIPDDGPDTFPDNPPANSLTLVPSSGP